jgi:hypothetical protein
MAETPPSRTASTKGWTSESGMPGEGLDTPGYGVKEEPNGRASRGGPYLHQRRHPTPVDGCFGCRIASVGISLAPHASTRGDGIGLASELKLTHQAMARAQPERYAPVGKRWV